MCSSGYVSLCVCVLIIIYMMASGKGETTATAITPHRVLSGYEVIALTQTLSLTSEKSMIATPSQNLESSRTFSDSLANDILIFFT